MSNLAPQTFEAYAKRKDKDIALLQRRGKPLTNAAFRAARNRNRAVNGNFRTNSKSYVSGSSLAVDQESFDGWLSAVAGTTLTFTSAPQGQPVTINAGKGIYRIVKRANVEAGSYVLSWAGTAQGRVYNSGSTPPSYASSPVLVTLDGLADVALAFGPGTLSQVQIESGSTPTPFERIPVSEERLQISGFGLRPVIPSSVSLGVGTASIAADGTIRVLGGNSISINGFMHAGGTGRYKLIIRLNTTAGAAGDYVLARFVAGGSTLSSALYSGGTFARQAAAAPAAFKNGNGLTFGYIGYSGFADYEIDIMGPFDQYPKITVDSNYGNGANVTDVHGVWVYAQSPSAIDGFWFSQNSTGLVDATIEVYEYVR